MKLTKQEMFDRAVNGLASQGFEKCCTTRQYQYHLKGSGEPGEPAKQVCVYKKGNMHCAWGWVDPEVDEDRFCTVQDLRKAGIGLAADMDESDLSFAMRLQQAHDMPPSPSSMKKCLQELGDSYGLTLPVVLFGLRDTQEPRLA